MVFLQYNDYRRPRLDRSVRLHDIVTITPVLFDLHWLRVKFRIHYRIAVLAFKSVYAIAPEYLCNLVTIKDK